MLSTGSKVSKDDDSNGDYRAVRKAVEWMADKPPQPFLLFLPGRGAHPPYGSPHEFHTKWDPADIRARAPLRPPYGHAKPKYHSYDRGVPHYRNLTGLPEEELYRLHAVRPRPQQPNGAPRSPRYCPTGGADPSACVTPRPVSPAAQAYLGMISYTDWIFGELLDGIKASGLEDSTAVFFSSDHGDFAGDYRLVEKWPGGADDVLTRVPLYARLPRPHAAAAGFVSRAPVSLFDVPHTICELAGVDVTGDGSGPNGINFGVSFADTLRRGAEGDLSRF
eukprot:4091334-Prymnesium_polylepis.1